MLNFLILALFSSLAFGATNVQKLAKIQNLTRISFGSCTDQNDPQPLWRDLINQKPDLWIWGGDNVYVDWDKSKDIKVSYDKQNKIPDYVEFKKHVPIIGTWDDHDYGVNNGDGKFQGKKLSQKLALDFLEEPLDSPRRKQEGIYTSYEFNSYGHKVKVILLDARYFKNLEKDYPMLGKKQWNWFEGELKNSNADIHFVMSGTPFLNPNLPHTEEWSQTKDYKRLLDLLDRMKPRGLVLLSGDKHFSSYYFKKGHLEFMSSGMTHVASKTWQWPMKQLFPNAVFKLNYGQIDISWVNSTPIITLSIRTQHGVDLEKKSFIWQDSGWIEY